MKCKRTQNCGWVLMSPTLHQKTLGDDKYSLSQKETRFRKRYYNNHTLGYYPSVTMLLKTHNSYLVRKYERTYIQTI